MRKKEPIYKIDPTAAGDMVSLVALFVPALGPTIAIKLAAYILSNNLHYKLIDLLFLLAPMPEDIKIEEPIDIADGYYLLRELDTLPTIIHKEDLKLLAKTY